MFTIHTVIVRFLDLPFVDADTKTKGVRTIVVGLRRFEVDMRPVRCPYGVPIRSDTERKAIVRSRRVSADFKWISYGVPWNSD